MADSPSTPGGRPGDGAATNTATDRDGPAGGPSDAPEHRHHRGRIVVAVAATLFLAACAFVVGSYVFRSTPGARSVDDALGDFRSSSTVAPRPSFHQPAAGVYTAAGQGKESLSTPALSQTDGATMPVTVRLLAKGCWLWRIDYNSAHWHEYKFCPVGKGLILAAQRNFQSWDLGVKSITNLATTTCDPPAAILVAGAEPGDTVHHSCRGVNTASSGANLAAGPSTMVGEQTLTIGGRPVRTIHQRRKISLSKAQTGEIDEDWWLQTGTGLPVRVDRTYHLVTDSIIGKVTYQERGSWQLTSMTPRT